MASEFWYTLPSGAHATCCKSGLLVQRTTMAGRLSQAVLLSWEDVAYLAAIARAESFREAHAPHTDAQMSEPQAPWPEVIGI